jgi:hypothetical protein
VATTVPAICTHTPVMRVDWDSARYGRRLSVVRDRMAPWANRSGIKEPNDEYEILSLRRERTTTAALPPASLSWVAMLDRQLCHHRTKQRRFERMRRAICCPLA